MIKSEVTRAIKPAIQFMLWGIAAGRCEFAGCNKRLWQSSVTKEQVNIAQKAHIWSFSPAGPRGNEGINSSEINSLENLMLVCHECHKLIDEDTKGNKYSVPLLVEMKRKHENRIDLATSISPDKNSHILLYGANIGEHHPVLNYREAAEAIFPDYYPADNKALELGVSRSPITDGEDDYWVIERSILERNFNKLIKPLLANDDIQHLSVFALAPQPLLIVLGKLLSDITAVSVFQRIREPQTWAWQNNLPEIKFQVLEPNNNYKKIALNLSLSGTVDNNRIHKVLGNNVSIWTLTIPDPNNDFLKSKSQLSHFRKFFRSLMDKIKSRHGHEQELHIFPAVPVSIAVEMGRTYMPKADLILILYDEIKNQGFVRAFNL